MLSIPDQGSECLGKGEWGGLISGRSQKHIYDVFFSLSILIPDEVCGEEDHEDSEYNFMAEDQREEKEEYRNDRAVRIPRKWCSSFSLHKPSFKFVQLKIKWKKSTELLEDGQEDLNRWLK